MVHVHAPVRNAAGDFCVEHDHAEAQLDPDHDHSWLGSSPRPVTLILHMSPSDEISRNVVSLESLFATAGPV